MTAGAISKLAEHVLDAHQHHQDPERLTIIPVVLIAPSSGASDADALRLHLDDGDGTTIIAGDNAAGTRGKLTGDLAQLVFATLDEHGRDDVRINQVGEGVVATVDGVTTATASEAQKVLFGLLASLFDARLHGSQLAALVYDESEFDGQTADMLWSLCTAHIAKVNWPTLRTLVVVARAGNVVAERHFRRQASARYVLNGDSLDARRSWETDNTDLKGVARADGRLVLFLAAGFSTSSKTDDDQPLALGNELRDRALSRLLHDTASGDELARRFLRYCKDRHALLPGERRLTEEAFAASLTLERVLVHELSDPPDHLGPTLDEFRAEVEQAHRRPGVAVDALRDFLERGCRRVVIITVNLDDLVERHCGDLVIPIVSDEDFSAAALRVRDYWENGGPSPLLKLHGTLADPPTMVASVHSVELGLSDHKIASIDAALLADDGARTMLCYVGSSMRDRDLNQLLGLRRYAERLEEFWIAPTIAQSVREFVETYRRRRWLVSGVDREPEAHCITLLADDFLAELARSCA